MLSKRDLALIRFAVYTELVSYPNLLEEERPELQALYEKLCDMTNREPSPITPEEQKVYTVTLKVRYEGSTLLGIFSTLEKANKYAKRQNRRYRDMSDAYVDVEAFVVD